MPAKSAPFLRISSTSGETCQLINLLFRKLFSAACQGVLMPSGDLIGLNLNPNPLRCKPAASASEGAGPPAETAFHLDISPVFLRLKLTKKQVVKSIQPENAHKQSIQNQNAAALTCINKFKRTLAPGLIGKRSPRSERRPTSSTMKNFFRSPEEGFN
jgi:hypothetical protein